MSFDSESESESESKCIVIDNGSYKMKAGFGGEDMPSSVLPTVIGKPRQPYQGSPYLQNNCIGDSAYMRRGYLSLRFPLSIGKTKNWWEVNDDWDDMGLIWSHIFTEELRVDSKEHSVLMTDNVLYSKRDREKMIQILFETLNVPSAYIANQSVLALIASEKENGICISSGGYGSTLIVPVYEGHAIKARMQKVDVNGSDLDSYMLKILTERGYSFTGSVENVNMTRDVKEIVCFIAKDFDAEMKKKKEDIETKYELPDGQILTIGNERFRCPEPLFNPSLIGKECDGLGTALNKCINGFDDADLREELRQNIVFCGGTTLFDGIVDRMYNEMECVPKMYKAKYLIDGFIRCKCNGNSNEMYADIQNLTQSYCQGMDDPNNWMYAGQNRVKIVAPPERKYSAWIGGSILSSLEGFKDTLISREEYDEKGPGIVHKKCF